ncbi:unnamed protein product [Nezara viridula]|uniref:Uncharacterized protein n=1 Tax=Nezara viridula TaxID=85310 RepID=A0A9P0HP85_NEZVI|nr:unnamed protein product [Nezara viridula]
MEGFVLMLDSYFIRFDAFTSVTSPRSFLSPPSESIVTYSCCVMTLLIEPNQLRDVTNSYRIGPDRSYLPA